MKNKTNNKKKIIKMKMKAMMAMVTVMTIIIIMPMTADLKNNNYATRFTCQRVTKGMVR